MTKIINSVMTGPFNTLQGSLDIGNIFSTVIDKNSKFYKKYEVFESTEDLLALSCAWYRLRSEQKQSHTNSVMFPIITKLLDSNLFGYTQEEDRILAGTIRDYYSKKIMLWKLKDDHMSAFREDLNKFIHSDGTKFIESTFGLVYRLPQFYFYDKQIDKIFLEKNKEVTQNVNGIETKVLTYIDTTVVDRKLLKKNEYWFSDDNNNVSVVFVEPSNSLLSIWEQLIQKPIELRGLFYKRKKDDKEYYQVEKYQMILG